MSRKHIGINCTYLIVGLDDRGIEHFIGSSCGSGWLVTFIRMIRYKFNYKYRDRYVSIYMRKFEYDC